MPNPDGPKPKPGLIVEDATVVGGTDADTGAPVIRPKTPEGVADDKTMPTDLNEAAKPKAK